MGNIQEKPTKSLKKLLKPLRPTPTPTLKPKPTLKKSSKQLTKSRSRPRSRSRSPTNQTKVNKLLQTWNIYPLRGPDPAVTYIKNKRTQRTQLSRNFRCNKSLEECLANVGITSVSLNDNKIGYGSYGDVYEFTAKIKNQGVRLVAKKLSEKNPTETDIANLFDEAEYALYMSEAKIGPEVYYTFFKYFPKKEKITQYIIMERFDRTCYEFLEEIQAYDYRSVSQLITHIDINKKIECVDKMVSLLKKQIFEYNLFCSDTKPNNYMINVADMRVVLIDFSPPFCRVGIENRMNYIVDLDKRVDLFYFVQLLQIKITILSMGYSIKSKIFGPIDSDPIFKNKKDYLSRYAYKLISDQQLQLYHYAGSSDTSPLYELFKAAGLEDMYYSLDVGEQIM